jgi:hypothetical protein
VFPGTVAIHDDEGVSGVSKLGLGKGAGLCHKRLDGRLQQVEGPRPFGRGGGGIIGGVIGPEP